MHTTLRLLLAVLCAPCVTANANPAEYHAAMLALAQQSGCMSCHSLDRPAKRLDGLPPIAPALREIATKYLDDAGAADRLTRTVMTGSNPAGRHWAGKVSDVQMPPNGTVVSPADARRLVHWILVLAP